jgi:hypothetical protein
MEDNAVSTKHMESIRPHQESLSPVPETITSGSQFVNSAKHHDFSHMIMLKDKVSQIVGH